MKWIYLIPRQFCIVGIAAFNYLLPGLLGFDYKEWVLPYMVWCVVSILAFVTVFPLKGEDEKKEKNEV